jgi:cellulose synthase/poly-beta-1,6-N-acetylglucosamine synthase-like glycosyltransferase
VDSSVTTGDPRISVIVPAYNAEDTIERCLQALESQTVPRERYEIIVVDDGSCDQTCARVQAQDGVRLLTQAHAGPAAARNLGVQHARREIVLFTDADCEPTPDWIERMVDPFYGENANPHGMSLPRSSRGQAVDARESPRGQEVVGVKGTYLTQQQEWVARFVQMEYEAKYDRMARELFIDFVDTYAAGYRRDVFLANGGFEVRFPVASVEDQEFSFRLARRGYKMIFVPEARVYHWGHPHNLGAYWRKKFRIGYWKVLVHRRHPDKLLRDSHTPQSLKVQILLVGLGSLCLLGSMFWPPLGWGFGLLGLMFLLTTLPFVVKAWRKEPGIAVVSPGLLLVRALALGAGFAAGLVAHFGFGGREGE